MRVILTVNFSPWSPYSGGGQRSTHNLATALAGRGHAVTVVYTRPPWERFEMPADLQYAVTWAALPSRRSRSGAPLRPFTAVTVARAVAQLVDRHPGQPIAVHGNGEEAALVPRLRPRRRFAFVMTPRYPSFPAGMRDGTWRRRITGLRHWVRGTKYATLGLALRGADRYCPTSQSSAAEVARVYGLDAARCRVVPNGVSPAFFEVVREAEADRGPLVFFGRMAREKGVDTLVEALGRLGEAAPDAVLIGRGPMVDPVRRRLDELGLASRVEMIPWLEGAALAARVASASMVVLPSLEESFGNAMAEAMATGAPVVSTTAGSIPEVVGDAGLLVPPEDPAALAEAIARLRTDTGLRARLGQAGRRRAADRFSWPAVAGTFASIYEEALAG
jgi:glycosyltransferase involved in cell wall biosynthesis